MPKKRYHPKILSNICGRELETGRGPAVLDACRQLGIIEQTYYRWKKSCGELRVEQATRLKTLKSEDGRSVNRGGFPHTDRRRSPSVSSAGLLTSCSVEN
jgi:hypothetical protein